MASFFSYWHRAIGSKWGPPRFLLNWSLLEYVKFGALELVLIVSPLYESELYTICFVRFLIFQGGFS